MRLHTALLLLSLLPATLAAQYGGMGGMGGRRGGYGDEMSGRRGLPKFATAKELERFNAADALLRETTKLKLTEAQVAQLTTLRAQLYERNADLLVRYDSVRRRLPSAQGPREPEPGQRVRPAEPGGTGAPGRADARDDGGGRAAQWSGGRSRSPPVLALVDEGQRDKANKVLEDQTTTSRKPCRSVRRTDVGGSPSDR